MKAKEEARQQALRTLSAHFKNLDTTGLEVYFILFAVSEKIRNKAETWLAKYDLNRARFSPLAMLFTSENKMLKPSELAEHAGVTRATMTGILDVLEKSGLIERVNDAEDRRQLNIQLTTAGDKLMRKVMPLHFQNISKTMSGVSEAERRSVASIFRKIEANIEEIK